MRDFSQLDERFPHKVYHPDRGLVGAFECQRLAYRVAERLPESIPATPADLTDEPLRVANKAVGQVHDDLRELVISIVRLSP